MILTVYSLYTRERCNSDINKKKKKEINMEKIIRLIGKAFIVYLSISFIGACFEWSLFIFGVRKQ